jgi:hypothetical protein
VLAAVPPACRVVTHYESYFTAPRAELRRVLRLVDVVPPRGAVARACAGIAATLAHHRGAPDDLGQVGPPGGLAASYRALCAEAGWRPAAAPRGRARGGAARREAAAPRPAPPAVPG